MDIFCSQCSRSELFPLIFVFYGCFLVAVFLIQIITPLSQSLFFKHFEKFIAFRIFWDFPAFPGISMFGGFSRKSTQFQICSTIPTWWMITNHWLVSARVSLSGFDVFQFSSNIVELTLLLADDAIKYFFRNKRNCWFELNG